MKNVLIIIAALMFCFSGCTGNGLKDDIARPLGIDISSAEVITEEDDHGGFHGDGTAFISLDCSGTDIADQINADGSWTAFPLDDTVRALVYGVEMQDGDSEIQMGPYLTDGDGHPLIPEAENGYYLLIDEQAEEGRATGADILHRASFNFKLGIYDSDADILYYFELDT